MPNQPKGQNQYGDGDEQTNTDITKKDSPLKQKPAPQKQEKSSSAGWFGGIWSKLAPKPKNQMKLPDDKNPTVNTILFHVFLFFFVLIKIIFIDRLGFREKEMD